MTRFVGSLLRLTSELTWLAALKSASLLSTTIASEPESGPTCSDTRPRTREGLSVPPEATLYVGWYPSGPDVAGPVYLILK